MTYYSVEIGDKKVREYRVINNSPLFEGIGTLKNYVFDWQAKSYENFIEDLKGLFDNYFPASFKDYNNEVFVKIEQVEVIEPSISEKQAIDTSQTWSYSVYFFWNVEWRCDSIQIKFGGEGEENVDKKDDLGSSDNNFSYEDSLIYWAKSTFDSLKSGSFSISEKSANVWEIREIDSSDKDAKREKEDGVFVELKIDKKKSEDLKLEGCFLVNFVCKQRKKVFLCSMPKITSQGNFLVNGHRKAVVFQSVRAPSVYDFPSDNGEDGRLFTELIPIKGSWIKLWYGSKKKDFIELKFLNSGLVVNFFDILSTFSFPEDYLGRLFDSESLELSDYSKSKKLDIGITLPRFLFTEDNSYFKMGRLGRRKCDNKIGLSSFFKKINGRRLASDFFDINGKKIFIKGELIDERKISIIFDLLKKGCVELIDVPHSSDRIFSLRIFIDTNDENGDVIKKEFFVITNDVDFSDGKKVYRWKDSYRRIKNHLDLSDLICIVSNHIGLYYELSNLEKIESKDNLGNQFIRRVGDLFYNIFDNKLGGFLKAIDDGYLAYLSGLNHVNLLQIPALREFEKSFRNFSNVSVLVQLLNENNPWSENSHMQKVSVLGYGGFSDKKNSGATLDARNANYTYSSKYDLVETPEGPKVGLIHYLTSLCRINDDGQLEAPYYVVKNGMIYSDLIYLDSDEEYNNYIVHPSIRISSDNEILDSKLPVFYKGKIIIVEREKINYIFSSFYQLNSFSTSAIPFFEKNDPTRTLMAANLNKQALPTFCNQEPLILSGVESSLFSNSSLTIKSDVEGIVDYVDSSKIIIKGDNNKKFFHEIPQLAVSNKNIVNFSRTLVKKNDFVKKDQAISCGFYFSDNKILSLGYNLKVAYMCWHGFNYEDAIILSDRLIKKDIFTYFFAKKHVLVRSSTKHGEEVLTKSISNMDQIKLSNLDDDGIIRVGSKVKGGDILVGKLTPQPTQHKESEEELLLLNILGVKSQRFVDSSLYLPRWENGVVYEIKRRKLEKKVRAKSYGDLEIIEVYVAEERKVEVGDKLTTRFGNKGVVAKIVEESNMPFNEKGESLDMILNPLGIPSRMNLGQSLEAVLAKAAENLNTNFLFKPFNSPDLKITEEIMNEAGIENFGSEKLFDGMTGISYQNKVFGGLVYTFLLNHKVADKIYSRNIGPRSLITQQPLKGRANDGGLRLGEMEISALLSHGANKNIYSSLVLKSDGMSSRRKYRETNTIPFGGGEKSIEYNNGRIESFNRILQTLRGIGFNLEAFDANNEEIDFYSYFSGMNRKEGDDNKKKKVRKISSEKIE